MGLGCKSVIQVRLRLITFVFFTCLWLFKILDQKLFLFPWLLHAFLIAILAICRELSRRITIPVPVNVGFKHDRASIWSQNCEKEVWVQQWRLYKTVDFADCRLWLFSHLQSQLNPIIVLVFKIGYRTSKLSLVPHGDLHCVREVLHVFAFDQLDPLHNHEFLELSV